MHISGYDEKRPHDDHEADGRHLYERSPELKFPKDPDAEQIDEGDDRPAYQCARPRRNGGPPERDVDANHGELGHADADVAEPVIPSGEESGKVAPVSIGVIAERAGHRFMDAHLPQGAHYHVNDDTDDGIGNNDCGACNLEYVRRAVEQARSHGPPDGDHLQVAVLQEAMQMFHRLLFIYIVLFRICFFPTLLLYFKRNDVSGDLYIFPARQLRGALPMGRHALQEMHSALSAPFPENHKFSRSGCRMRGLLMDTKSAAPDSSTSSILLNDLSPPTRMTVAFVFSLIAFAPGRK